MYRTLDSQLSVYDFLPPYHGELSPDNRWVRLAAAVDWDAYQQQQYDKLADGLRAGLDMDLVHRIIEEGV